MDQDEQEFLIKDTHENTTKIYNFIDGMLDYLEDEHNLRFCRKCFNRLATYEDSDKHIVHYCHGCPRW